MIILSVFFAGFIGLICLVLFLTEYFDMNDFLITPLIIFILCLISCVGSIIYVNKIPSNTTWEESWKTNIIALKDNSNVEGKLGGGIFVTSGYIKESMYYYCMELTEEGKHMIKIPSGNAYIMETNDKNPSIAKKVEKYIDDRYSFWFPTSTKEKYIIYVPKGTVDTTYNIDLQ